MALRTRCGTGRHLEIHVARRVADTLIATFGTKTEVTQNRSAWVERVYGALDIAQERVAVVQGNGLKVAVSEVSGSACAIVDGISRIAGDVQDQNGAFLVRNRWNDHARQIGSIDALVEGKNRREPIEQARVGNGAWAEQTRGVRRHRGRL